MAKQTFIVSAGDRSITTTKTGIKSSIDTLLDEGFTTIVVTDSNRKYTVGDKVRIVANTTNHGFLIGETVEVTAFDDDNNLAVKSIRDEWSVSIADIK
jgi:hypothetical protein